MNIKPFISFIRTWFCGFQKSQGWYTLQWQCHQSDALLSERVTLTGPELIQLGHNNTKRYLHGTKWMKETLTHTHTVFSLSTGYPPNALSFSCLPSSQSSLAPLPSLSRQSWTEREQTVCWMWVWRTVWLSWDSPSDCCQKTHTLLICILAEKQL